MILFERYDGRGLSGVEAGSTGKPNRAAELANIERIMPFLLQILALIQNG